MTSAYRWITTSVVLFVSARVLDLGAVALVATLVPALVLAACVARDHGVRVSVSRSAASVQDDPATEAAK
ncbi:hypothetical protein [Halocalculus aciditolerans]|uniref:DUF3099 domain-containing protein n=1 Tax=Halocalculus aciditolerans TaxID=1383812 RepID=A0A830F3R0_9EURY|nr:hypothetical protein [Halocalculus aciditolerans]GGL60290.1 hypothetical protein GCM10009039_18180 [Halocalculus aciditolerans]